LAWIADFEDNFKDCLDVSYINTQRRFLVALALFDKRAGLVTSLTNITEDPNTDSWSDGRGRRRRRS
jgi:hypothetical protein